MRLLCQKLLYYYSNYYVKYVIFAIIPPDQGCGRRSQGSSTHITLLLGQLLYKYHLTANRDWRVLCCSVGMIFFKFSISENVHVQKREIWGKCKIQNKEC